MKDLLEKIAGLLTLSGICLFGYQLFFWLKEGVWRPYPLKYTLTLFPENSFSNWIDNPQAWIGLNKLLSWILDLIPISVAAIVLGLLFLSIADSLPAKNALPPAHPRQD